MISAGNEPVTDMADYLDYLVDDPATEIIALVVEKIRRAGAFFAAAAQAAARPGSRSSRSSWPGPSALSAWRCRTPGR